MPFLAYFIFVGAILMGMMMLTERAKNPLLTPNTSSQIQPQKVPPKTPTVKEQFTERQKLSTKHKTAKGKVARSETKSADSSYYINFIQ